MCLLVPGKLISIERDKAVVDYGIEQRTVAILDDGYAVGDYVLVRAGVIVDKVSEKEAQEALAAYQSSME